MRHQKLHNSINETIGLLRALGVEDEHRALVARLVDQCEIAAMSDQAEHGHWEQHELELARAALASGRLRLALTAARNAVQVSELPSDEYDYGWNFRQQQKSDDIFALRAEAEYNIEALQRLSCEADDKGLADVALIYQNAANTIRKLVRTQWGRIYDRERNELLRAHGQLVASGAADDATRIA